MQRRRPHPTSPVPFGAKKLGPALSRVRSAPHLAVTKPPSGKKKKKLGHVSVEKEPR